MSSARGIADCVRMHERFAVSFREGSARAAGALDVEQDRLVLHGRTDEGELTLEIPFAQLSEVRAGCLPTERLDGYATILLERPGLPTVQIAPLGIAMLPEITALLCSLTHPEDGDTLVVVVPLKPGCLNHARDLLAKGPPLDPASLGLRSHEVYLGESEATFVFNGSNVQARMSNAIRQPALWRAGLAWQRCFAGAPRIFRAVTPLGFESEPVYRWRAAAAPAQDSIVTSVPIGV